VSAIASENRPAASPETRRRPVQDLDPRLRIGLATILAVVVVSLNTLPALLAAVAVSVFLAIKVGLAVGPTLNRLAAVESFMVVILAFLPFTVPGQAVFAIGPFPASAEGLHQAARIVLTANAVVIAVLALVGTLEPAVLGHALARLGVPEKVVHLMLFTIRYVPLLRDEYDRLRQAMKARGFRARGTLHTWRSLGWLFGMLLVRSFERSERILDAMKCRGFQGRYHLIDNPVLRPSDGWFALAMGSALILLVLIERSG
jgi:cobalt/nickel transport system permease protein